MNHDGRATRSSKQAQSGASHRSWSPSQHARPANAASLSESSVGRGALPPAAPNSSPHRLAGFRRRTTHPGTGLWKSEDQGKGHLFDDVRAMQRPNSGEGRGTSSLEYRQDRERTSTCLHDVTRLLQVSEDDVGFYLGVEIGVIPHGRWGRTRCRNLRIDCP